MSERGTGRGDASDARASGESASRESANAESASRESANAQSATEESTSRESTSRESANAESATEESTSRESASLERESRESASDAGANGSAVLSGWAAAWLQAGWTARRLLRRRLLWVAGFFALGPIAVAVLVVHGGHAARWDTLFAPLLVLSGIVPPLLTGSAVAEEIEDLTFTYLWSRPLPRWSVLIGKLVGTAPISALMLCLTTLICYQVAQRSIPGDHLWPGLALPRALGAVALAALAVSMISAGVAILMPRHGLGVAYAYLLVLDLPLGAMPFSIAKLSVAHHILVLGGLDPARSGSAQSSALWLLGIGAFWLILGLWRVSGSEFASGGER